MIRFDDVRELTRTLPGIEHSVIHGASSLKAGSKLLACPAIHKSAEPNSLMVRISLEQRAELINSDPDVYYVTDHYVKYPSVLVRMSRIHRDAMRDLLGMSLKFMTDKSSKKKPAVRTRRA